MKYVLSDTGITKINEKYGTIQNVGNRAVEISPTEEFEETFLLKAGENVSFTKPLYVRVKGKLPAPQKVKLNVSQFVNTYKTTETEEEMESGTTATTAEVTDFLDDIFSGGTTVIENDEVNDFLDSIFSGDEVVYGDSETEEYLDGIFSGNG